MIRASSLDDDYQSSFTNGSNTAIADVPREKGGRGEGFGPHELLEAALATCMTMTVRMFAEKHQFDLEIVDCEVVIDRSVPERPTMRYHLSLRGQLSLEQEEQLRDAASRCPVAKTLAGRMEFKRVEQGASHERS